MVCLSSTFRSTIDIDVVSRRTKTKCNGDRPQCRSCVKRRVACSWPQIAAPSVCSILTPPQDQTSDQNTESTSRAYSHSVAPGVPLVINTVLTLPAPHLLQRLIDLFLRRHHDVEFCSFFHKPSLDIPDLSVRSPLLVASVICLAALYVPDNEVIDIFGFQTPLELSDHYALLAQSYTHSVCYEPSSKYVRLLCSHLFYYHFVFTNTSVSSYNPGLSDPCCT
jgi:hypothetical protein